ncbi:hypothetical protein [Glutamicibacter sp. NPDC087344]|uniref:hypothetical protein n=1 Tax=Glutamicibacter sp. NPDC087344 TaxID=3363994 RepID=UPI0038247EA0
MSDHKISADGLRIECHAAQNADCRTRPGCEAEGWGEEYCIGHDPGHPVAGGHECWQLAWVNNTSLEETYDGPGAPVTIYPGRAVRIVWNGYECTWDYKRRNANA